MKTCYPKPQGEYAVGTTTYSVYSDRDEVYPGHEGVKRSVAARIYYPVFKESVSGLSKERYMSREIAADIKSIFKIPVNYDRMEAEGENVSECYRDAPFIPDRKFPLIMFNHGYPSYREGNSFLCIELASRGYVVIAVAHSYDSMAAVLDDGTVFEFDRLVLKKMYEPMLKGLAAAWRLTKMKASNEELADAFDDLQMKYCAFVRGRLPEWVKDTETALGYAKEHFGDLIDLSFGVGISGHSMGGAAAYSLCLNNPEFVCGINIDGGLFGEHGDKIMDKPFLQVNCKDNVNVVTRGFVKKSAPAYRILFRDMRHPGFSDMKYYIPFGSMVGKLDNDLCHENLCNCHLEFFDTYLKKIRENPRFSDNEAVTVEKY